MSMLDDGGTEILAGHGSFHGTGQMSVVTDSLVVYHYYRDDGQARLGINALDWVDDWPVIEPLTTLPV